MRNRCARLRPSALLALLLAGGVSVVSSSCNVNEVETWVYNSFFKSNTKECRECGVGQYGSDGKCYDCPSFTRRRQDRDPNKFSGTLWCSNSCAEMYAKPDANPYGKYRQAQDVYFNNAIRSKEQARSAVLAYFTSKDSYSGEPRLLATCQPCEAGKFLSQYMAQNVLTYHKHDLAVLNYTTAQIDELVSIQGRLQRFTWSLCRACPTGLVPGMWTIPEDVREMTGDGALKPVNTELVIPCTACSVLKGVPVTDAKTGVVNCKPCENRMYQLAKSETFIAHRELKKTHFGDELITLTVGANCAHCPAGKQALWAGGATGFWRGAQCRGSAEEECCSPCPLNQFKEKAEDVCNNALADHVVLDGDSFTLSGGLRQRACGAGERLTYCTDNGCDKNVGWRTCLPCSLDETTFELPGSGCAQCEPGNFHHLVDKSNPKQCAECGTCDELQVKPSEVQLLKITGFSKAPSEYLVVQKSATCAPLQVRRLEKSNGVLALAGDAHWRQRSRALGEPLPPHHYLDRTNGTNCRKAQCSGRCQQLFMYSEGCGNSVTPDKTWVQKTKSNPQRLSSVSPADVTDTKEWTVLSQGHCQFCTPCDAGKFNEGCDKQSQYELGKPEGECKQCKVTCFTGSFLLHPEKEAGCHDPPVHLNSTDNSRKFQTLHDYTCEPCPKWVKDGQKLSIVAACGLQSADATYDHYSAQTVNNVVQKTAKPVLPMERGDDLLALVPRKNFRGFMDNRLDYCPSGYFFDSTIPGCDFVNNGKELKVHKRAVIVGYNAYQPACCRACKNCVGATQKKDMSSWRECTGNSLEDVQDRCVDKCVLGYWEETVGTGAAAEKRCKRCSSCFDGVV